MISAYLEQFDENSRTPRGVRGLKYAIYNTEGAGAPVAPLAGCVD